MRSRHSKMSLVQQNILDWSPLRPPKFTLTVEDNYSSWRELQRFPEYSTFQNMSNI